ncbi:hypothetical protein C8J56DRAFT_243864 [Mycena floridula]|nr:hypothetical protein C8J56DRAFT_243864 [Mycena floridula]
MRLSAIILSSALSAAFVSAQLQNIPPCAFTCVTTAAPGSCSITDVHCLCASPTFAPALIKCVQASCSAADQQLAFTAAQQLCLAEGVSLTVSPTLASKSESASTSRTIVIQKSTTKAVTTPTPTVKTSAKGSPTLIGSSATHASPTIIPSNSASQVSLLSGSSSSLSQSASSALSSSSIADPVVTTTDTAAPTEPTNAASLTVRKSSNAVIALGVVAFLGLVI